MLWKCTTATWRVLAIITVVKKQSPLLLYKRPQRLHRPSVVHVAKKAVQLRDLSIAGLPLHQQLIGGRLIAVEGVTEERQLGVRELHVDAAQFAPVAVGVQQVAHLSTDVIRKLVDVLHHRTKADRA